MTDLPSEPARSSPRPPVRLNLDAARTRARTWAQRMGMLDDPAVWTPTGLDAFDHGLLAAYAHPGCDPAELALLTEWYVWLSYFGDHFRATYKRSRDLAGARAHLDRLGAFPRIGEPANPVERGLADLWPRTVHQRSRAWRERFAASTRGLLTGAMWELRCVEADRIPNPLEYLRMRRRAGTARWATHLVEHAAGVEVPGRLAAERPLRVIADAFADAVHLGDDVAVHPYGAGGELADAVLVLGKFLGRPPREAADTVRAIAAARWRRFEGTALAELPAPHAEHAVTAGERAAITAYVRGLRDWRAGRQAWHLRSESSPDVPRHGPYGPGTDAVRPLPPRRAATGGPCTPGHPFRLPAFVMPWKAMVNRHLDAARRYAKAWAYEMGMIGPLAVRGDGVWTDPRYDALELVLRTALTHPVAEREHLHLLALWDVWMFALDDYFLAEFKIRRDLAGARAFVAGLRRFMTERTPPPATCVERGLADLWARTGPRLGAAARERLLACVLAFAEGNLWELGNTLRDRIPDPVDYAEMRRRTAGTELSTQLSLSIRWGDIAPELLASRPLRDLVGAFADNVDFRNDIFSFRKGIQQESDINNGVLVIQSFFDCGLQQAVEIVGDLLTSRLREFQRVQEEDLPLLFEELALDVAQREQVMTFVHGLERWMSGDLAWYGLTRRYTGPDRHGALAATPLRDAHGNTVRP